MAEHIEGPLNWERLGKEGYPMVFIHPNPTDHNCWLYQMAHLSFWYRTIGVDLPGYGKSPKADPGVTMPDIAQACWEAVDQVTGERVILVGLSVGAHVILHMASQRPDRSLALIISGSGYQPVKQFAQKRIAAYQEGGVSFRRQHAKEVLSAGFRDTPIAEYLIGMFTERNHRADAGSIIEMFRALGEPDPDWLYEGIKAPALIITGSEDGTHPNAFAMQKRIARCELVTIEGAGHACNLEQPWEFDRHMLDFLSRHGLLENDD